jgi:hypothetical protein
MNDFRRNTFLAVAKSIRPEGLSYNGFCNKLR